jgi:ThiF family
MSSSLINRNVDLKRLRDEGFDIEVRGGHLLVHAVPYLNANREVSRGTLISDLALAGEVTQAASGTHVIYFVGDHPCNLDGTEITQIKHSSGNFPLVDGFVARHSFSNKPANGYSDYHHKVVRYVDIISAPAKTLDSFVSAQTFTPTRSDSESSVFVYTDTASSRAGIEAASAKLAKTVTIVGLGGTGSYVLDLIAKTPAVEIHLFDGDRFLQHNAFRSPGAASLQALLEQPNKATYFQGVYDSMHRKIIAHPTYVTESNVNDLLKCDVVFLCVDKGSVRKTILERLSGSQTILIDVGLGVELASDTGQLLGTCRVTTVTPQKAEHARTRLSLGDADDDDLYARNIQIADLNMLNAAMAVIKWKKLCGFYADLDVEHHSTYSTHLNLLTSEETVA